MNQFLYFMGMVGMACSWQTSHPWLFIVSLGLSVWCLVAEVAKQVKIMVAVSAYKLNLTLEDIQADLSDVADSYRFQQKALEEHETRES